MKIGKRSRFKESVEQLTFIC